MKIVKKIVFWFFPTVFLNRVLMLKSCEVARFYLFHLKIIRRTCENGMEPDLEKYSPWCGIYTRGRGIIKVILSTVFRVAMPGTIINTGISAAQFRHLLKCLILAHVIWALYQGMFYQSEFVDETWPIPYFCIQPNKSASVCQPSICSHLRLPWCSGRWICLRRSWFYSRYVHKSN